MSETLTFLVQGSEPEPYTVTIIRDAANVTARCTCAAGIIGTYCKHRVALLTGESVEIVSPNAVEAAAIPQWVAGTDVEHAIAELRQAESRLEVAKREVASLKKALARALNN